jgi:hypothetical protein
MCATDCELYSIPSLTTFTLLRFNDTRRWWMLAQMGLARPVLHRAAGLRFWKLLGTGHGSGFSLQPNWNCYGVIGVWDDTAVAQNFLHRSAWMEQVRRRADEVWTAYLQPTQSRGQWSGSNPFTPAIAQPSAGPIIVLTRATIRLSKLRAFWSAVPGTSDALERHAGLILSIGVGEAPFGRQATFSIWRDEQAIRDYARKERAHAEVIRRTRDEGWYAEELFARFALIASEGTWAGGDPLKSNVKRHASSALDQSLPLTQDV